MKCADSYSFMKNMKTKTRNKQKRREEISVQFLTTAKDFDFNLIHVFMYCVMNKFYFFVFFVV